MENPSHPFYEPRRTSLVLLRRISLDQVWRHNYYMCDMENCYFGVDEDHPDRAIYIYCEFTRKWASC